MAENLMIRKHTGDMLALLRLVYSTINRQRSDARVIRMTEAHDLLHKISRALDDQISALQRHLVTQGGSPAMSWMAAIRESFANTVGMTAGVMEMFRPYAVSMMLRDDYTMLNMVAISYTMLDTAALAMNDQETAQVAMNGLNQLTPLIIQINELMPKVLTQELKNKAVEPNAASQASQDTQAAWQGQHVHQQGQAPSSGQGTQSSQA